MEKLVLDVCCGGKMFHFNKDSDLVTFCDKRNENLTLCDGRTYNVNPDITCDFKDLPFEDNTFRMVIFDPPHLINIGDNAFMVKKYGKLPKEWQEELSQGFAECFRVLAENGTLIFKWNETDIKVSEILKLTEYEPLVGHKSGKQQKTHWLTFIKNDYQKKGV